MYNQLYCRNLKQKKQGRREFIYPLCYESKREEILYKHMYMLCPWGHFSKCAQLVKDLSNRHPRLMKKRERNIS